MISDEEGIMIDDCIKIMGAVKDSNYYQILGLKEEATEGDIESRYRKLIFEYHPDRLNPEDIEDRITKVKKKEFMEKLIVRLFTETKEQEVCLQKRILQYC